MMQGSMVQTVYIEDGQRHFKLSPKIPDMRILGQGFYRFQCDRAETLYARQIKEWNLMKVDTEVDFLYDAYWYAESQFAVVLWRVRKISLKPYRQFVRFLYRCRLFRVEEAMQFSWGTAIWFWQKDYYVPKLRP